MLKRNRVLNCDSSIISGVDLHYLPFSLPHTMYLSQREIILEHKTHHFRNNKYFIILFHFSYTIYIICYHYYNASAIQIQLYVNRKFNILISTLSTAFPISVSSIPICALIFFLATRLYKKRIFFSFYFKI